MNNRYEVYAVRISNERVIAVKTELPDVISTERMKSLMSVDGFVFFININDTEYEFKFDGDVICEPSHELLRHISSF